MFTGIIEATSKLISRQSSGDRNLFKLERPKSFDDLKIGSSIACNGICLTVLSFDAVSFNVQVMHETVSKSTAGAWQSGELINLERALKLGDRLDGHWLQGHVDRTAKLLERSKINDAIYLKIELAAADKALVIPQGSIAVNGVSLTVAELGSNWLKVALIGHTLEHSNLGSIKAAQKVNIEYDVLGKYLLRGKTEMSKEWIFEQGF